MDMIRSHRAFSSAVITTIEKNSIERTLLREAIAIDSASLDSRFRLGYQIHWVFAGNALETGVVPYRHGRRECEKHNRSMPMFLHRWCRDSPEPDCHRRLH